MANTLHNKLWQGTEQPGPIIQNILKEGIFEHTISPFNFPIWWVFKPATNEWSLTVNYQNSNAQVPPVKAPMPSPV